MECTENCNNTPITSTIEGVSKENGINAIEQPGGIEQNGKVGVCLYAKDDEMDEDDSDYISDNSEEEMQEDPLSEDGDENMEEDDDTDGDLKDSQMKELKEEINELVTEDIEKEIDGYLNFKKKQMNEEDNHPKISCEDEEKK